MKEREKERRTREREGGREREGVREWGKKETEVA